MKKITVIILVTLSFCTYTSSAQETALFNWVKSLTGVSPNTTGSDVAIDGTGNVITTGSFATTTDFDPGAGVFNLTPTGQRDVFILKLDASGNFLWARTLGGVNYDDGFSLTTDASGNIYTLGLFEGTADFDPGAGTFNITAQATGANLFISKLDKNGNFVWAKNVGANNNNNYNYSELIVTDAAGNVYFTGQFYNTGDFDPGPGVFNMTATGSDPFIAKWDTNGNFVWARSFNGGSNETSRAIALDPDGNVYTAGLFHNTVDFDPGAGTYNITSPNNNDLYVSKLDANGNFIWAKAFFGSGTSSREYPQSLDIDASGNLLMIGYFSATADFDPGAAVYNITAVTGYDDVFISKLDKDGNFVWAKTFGDDTNTYGNSIITDPAGNSYYTGRFSSTVDFDPGAGVLPLTAATSDMFVAKLDASGSFVWAVPISGQNGADGAGINIDAAGNIYTTGRHNGVSANPTDFDPSDCSYNLTGSFFVEKLTPGAAPPAPTIASFSPASGSVGTSVTITGTNFSPVLANNTVNFFNNKTGTITSATSTEIIAVVPSGTTTGKISILSNCVKVTSTTDFTFIVGPVITSFTPTTGAVNTTVTITGTNFSSTPANNLVKFNGTSATVTASSSTSITTKVPAGATTGTISVTVAGNTGTSSGVFTVPGTITITPQPVTTTSVCTGATPTLTTAATGTTNITYQWQFSTTSTGTYTNISNGGGYSNVSTSSLSINTTGNFGGGFYKCRISGDLATPVLTNAARVIVSAIPLAPTVSDYRVCDYGSGGMAVLYASGGTTGTYRWYTVPTGGTAIPGETSYSYWASVTTAKTFYVSISNGACEGPRTPAVVTIEIAPPTPTITSNKPLLNNTVTGCPGEVILSGPPGFDSYLWYPVEDNGQQWVVTESGSYTVRVYDETTGCESEDSDPVIVTVDATGCANAAPMITLESVSIPINGKVTLDLIPSLSDSDDNLDLESLSIVEPPQSGAEATISSDGILEIDYASVQFAGTDKVTIGVCDYFGECAQQELEITVIGDIVVYNGISPNNDGANDIWIIQYIDAIEETRNNKVSLFNRWGDEVFSVSNYNNDDRVFKGLNNKGNEVPSGVYYYKIEFTSGKPDKTGYVSLKK